MSVVSAAAWLSSFVRLSCRYRHLIGRLSNRFSHLGLLTTSCLAGIAYYLGLTFVTGPIPLITLQLLNTWYFAGTAGIGLPLFQQMIPRPGLSTGLYMNTRPIGSIVSGPIIAIGSLTVVGRPTRARPRSGGASARRPSVRPSASAAQLRWPAGRISSARQR